MSNLAVIFLAIAVIAAAAGLTGVAGDLASIAWLLFLVFIALVVASVALNIARSRSATARRIAILRTRARDAQPSV